MDSDLLVARRDAYPQIVVGFVEMDEPCLPSLVEALKQI